MRETYKHPETGAAIYYAPCVDHEDDVSKIWHDFRDCETSTYANLSMDWSPYKDPSKNDIKMWFALGCPDRRTIGDDKTVGVVCKTNSAARCLGQVAVKAVSDQAGRIGIFNQTSYRRYGARYSDANGDVGCQVCLT